MGYANFVHLRVHSSYSLSEGAIKIKPLIALAQQQRMPAVAITDSNNLFGALEFALAAREGGIQPIIGCQLQFRRKTGPAGKTASTAGPDQLLLLVQSEQGYLNLLHLVSEAYLNSAQPDEISLPWEKLTGHSEGLIALTGGPKGIVNSYLLEGKDVEAENVLQQLSMLFPDRLYVELMRHGLSEEDRTEDRLIDLAYKMGLPLVATNDVFFADPSLYEAHQALLCIAQGTTLADEARRRSTPEHYFKSAEEMRNLFADLPEAIDNSLVIARRCAYMPEARKPILPAFGDGNGKDEATQLRQLACKGLELRLLQQAVFGPELTEEAQREAAKPYQERLEFELSVIIEMGFAGYFLIVSDFIQWAKKQGIPVGPGRGSGAASVVAWALSITDLDPLRFGLLFERFLNPERVSMPDFDIDFCQDRRDEVIRYVQNKHGHDRVAQIITFGKLQARAALRDVGRVLGMPYGQVDRLCKLVPNNPANPVSLQQAITNEPQLQLAAQEDLSVAKLLDIALKLEGLYRHASTHAAGLVIGDRDLQELVPLYRDPRSSMPVTQFNMKYVELAGLVKFDFLGLKTLTVLAQAQALLERRGIRIDFERLPLDDEKTYHMLAEGEATGVFQMEGSGVRDVLRRLKPDRFEDLIAVVALYRPGPMDNIPKYIACKHGLEQPDYLHPHLEGILKETFGIMVYQEQVQRIAQTLAGYSLGGADLLRRAMGKKIKEEMAAQKKVFIDGAAERGVAPERAAYIFEYVAKFADYGFNKAHAAAYALIAYQTAYLKANYPVEFFAASMTLDINNTDKLDHFRQELSRLRINLLPPDINKSATVFSVEDTASGLAIRYALAAIKNVGKAAMDALVAEREQGGDFKNLDDFAQRLDAKLLNKRQLESLISAGALDTLHQNRKALLDGVELLLRYASRAAEERRSTQVSLFGVHGSAHPIADNALILPAAIEWGPIERLSAEQAAIGFYLSAHPLDMCQTALQRMNVHLYSELAGKQTLRSGRVKLAGMITGLQKKISAKGNRFAFLQLSDPSGSYDVLVFSDVLSEAQAFLEVGKPVVVTTELRDEAGGGAGRLMAVKIHDLEAELRQLSDTIRIHIQTIDAVDPLKAILTKEPSGKTQIRLALALQDGEELEILLPESHNVSLRSRETIAQLKGVTGLEVL